jgi:pimeloyl-ACP methyl ester carboxylesterase
MRDRLGLAAVALALLLTAGAARGADDDLKRGAFLGAAFGPPAAEDRARAGVAAGGAVIKQVLPGSTAEAAGLQAGDVITAIGGRPVDGGAGVVDAMARRKGGDRVTFAWSREGKAESKEVALKERPRESSDAHEVVYGAFPTKAGLLRTILTRPKGSDGKKHPALFFIQGIGGYSIDLGVGPGPMGYRAILDGFARKGYVTFRVEKPGQGDSEGGPTANVDFDTELEGYRQGLKTLRSLDFVDPDRVLVFGHSMGGVWGPLLGAEGGVKGIAIYGTALRTWYEYLLENARRQEELAGIDPAEIDAHLRQDAIIHALLLGAGRSAEQVAAQHPELKDRLFAVWDDGKTFAGRNLAFFRQLAAKNLPEAWSRFNGHALAIWGAADYVSSPDDHRGIARIVNRAHPGKGRYLELTASDHGFARADDPAASFAAASNGPGGEFNPAIVEALLAWADAVNGPAPR